MWAVERFGAQAGLVRERVVAAFLQAVANAQDAQAVSSSDKRFTYGSTLMIRRYETLVENLRDLPGVRTVKPETAPYELVLVGENLLFPFRYAEDDRTSLVEARIGDGRISGLAAALFRRFGARHTYVQEPLWGEEERPILAGLPADTRLIPLAYAANDQAGLIKLYWGEAALVDPSGHLAWTYHEEIPLAEGHLRGVSTPDGKRFDVGAVPDLTLQTLFPVDAAAAE